MITYKEILRLTIPNIVTTLLVPLAGIVDMIILGRLENITPLAGVTLGVVVFDYLFWGFGFLRMGTTAKVANLSGENKTEELKDFIGKSVTFALVMGLGVIALSFPIWKLAELLLSGSSDTLNYASQYFWGRIFSAPFVFSIYVMWGSLLGMKLVKRTLLFTCMVNVLNISLSYHFVLNLGMESYGVGLATALSDTIMFFIIFTHMKLENFISKLQRPVGIEFKELFLSNVDIIYRTILLVFFLSMFTNFSSSFSKEILVSNSILQKLFIICAYFYDGLAFSFESIVGQLKGAKNIDGLKDAIRKGIIVTTVMIIMAEVILRVFQDPIIDMFTVNEYIINLCKQNYIYLLVAIVGTYAFLFDGIFIGLMSYKKMRQSVFYGVIIGFPVMLYAQHTLNNFALWVGFILFFSTRSLYLYLQCRNELRFL